MNAVVITARIAEPLSAELDRLAKLRDRTRSWLIEKAISAFVQQELELLDTLKEADAETERGEYLTHELFMAELKAEFAQRRAT